jgi:hypothetical protein
MTTNAQFSKMVTDGKVSFKNLVIDVKKKSFSIDFAMIEGRQRKFNYQNIEGAITPELYNWFTNVFTDAADSSKVTKTTAFKKYLERKNIEYAPKVIRTLEWTCDNKSNDFDDCPFRLTISPAFGSATLNLVYKYPKIVKSQRFDPETGKTVKVYGYKKYSNMKKEYFRRLEIFIQK